MKQLFFDLDFSGSHPGKSSRQWRKRLAIVRGALRWLEREDPPTGLAVDVVTRISRLRADVAAFWSVAVRNPHDEGPTNILTPARTAIIQCYTEREECWPDCIKSGEILPHLRELKEAQAALEATIRAEEPNLRESSTLFDEYAEWGYENSRNREYHRVRRAMAKMEHGLYHGTKFERIRSAQLANHLYLAVPAGMVQHDELADGWGLLWVEDDLTVKAVATPEDKDCLPSNRVHLVQNIAAAAKDQVLFEKGIHRTERDEVVFVRPPRGHRKPVDLRLSSQ